MAEVLCRKKTWQAALFVGVDASGGVRVSSQVVELRWLGVRYTNMGTAGIGRVSGVLKLAGEHLIEGVKKDLLSGRPGLSERTGALKRSLRVRVGRGKNPSVKLTSTSPYFKMHDQGGTIYAKGVLLAIPKHEHLRMKGPISRAQFGYSIRGGVKLLVDRATKRPRFLLRSFVRIPKRIGLEAYILKNLMPIVQNLKRGVLADKGLGRVQGLIRRKWRG